jgi:hypothetical protein
MKTQREVDQRHYQADQCSHEERMQFEARWIGRSSSNQAASIAQI